VSSAESQTDTSSTPKPKSESGGVWSFIREIAIVLVSALILSVVVRTFFIQAFYVPSESMENVLMPNDRILASKITTAITGVGRGEVVVFKDPGGWLPDPDPSGIGPVHKALEFVGLLPSRSGDDLVKRVIGISGDHVMCCTPTGKIVLNGVVLDEPFIKPGGGTDQIQFDVTVPANNIFVMGDNRGASADSRFHLQNNSGGVPLDNVVGQVVIKVWPLNEWGTVGVPKTFENPDLNNQSAPMPTPATAQREAGTAGSASP